MVLEIKNKNMSLEDTKTQILLNVDIASKFDLSKLYPTNPSAGIWNNLTPEDLKTFVKPIIGVIKKIKKYPSVLNDLSFGFLNDLNNNLNNFINEFRPLENLEETQITTQHHSSFCVRLSNIPVQLQLFR